MWKRIGLMVCSLAVLSVSIASADDAYYHASLRDVELTEGALPTTNEYNWRVWRRLQFRPAYAVLDGEGEVYVHYSLNGQPVGGEWNTGLRQSLAIRVPQSRDITGRLFLPNMDGEQMHVLKFKVPSAKVGADSRQEFYRLKLEHFEDLLSRDLPGGAWFRHQIRQARQALGQPSSELAEGSAAAVRPARTGQLSDTYAVFSGGRAMSENLQLDRVLQAVPSGEETVDVASIEGVTVREIDWKPMVAQFPLDLDPLAAKIPADQHAIFFPSFSAAVAMADEMAGQGAPILQLAEPQSVSAQAFPRYQRQMCLTITELARMLGPQLARSVAITGSDPYFRTGTDVAVLFETDQPEVLENLLMVQVAAAASQGKRAEPIKGDVSGLAFRGARSDDREISCYVAHDAGAVIVTNSPHQLGQFVQVTSGKVPALASLDEYCFFRHRYPRGEANETAFLFLSDATIRRWCGPRWRIATSRRTRDLAVVAELQASQMDRLVSGNVPPGPLYTDLPLSQRGEVTLTADGVHSSTVGSLAFMTPIAELEMSRVTRPEAEAYRQWRDRYQSNWRWAFDPIGVQLGIHAHQLSADLTVMPLIWGSDYRMLIGVSQGASLRPDAGDQHDALAHIILALNTRSETLQQQVGILRSITGNPAMDPFGWLGDNVSVYVDDDPFWEEVAQVSPDELTEFLAQHDWRIPVALRAEVSSGLKLAAFLAALRAFSDQTAPGMLHWEALTYQDQPYVKVTPTERAIGRNERLGNVAVYYCASGEAWTVTMNENVLKRGIERDLVARRAREEGKPLPPPSHPWIGSNLALQFDGKVLQALASMLRDEYETQMQRLAFGNLPILNEWKRRYPQRDPVALHEELWKQRLLCPGGGEYVWNEQWQTMESTVYGCPAAPKPGPAIPPLLNLVKHGDFGLTFEEQGLRARVSLDR